MPFSALELEPELPSDEYQRLSLYLRRIQFRRCSWSWFPSGWRFCRLRSFWGSYRASHTLLTLSLKVCPIFSTSSSVKVEWPRLLILVLISLWSPAQVMQMKEKFEMLMHCGARTPQSAQFLLEG